MNKHFDILRTLCVAVACLGDAELEWLSEFSRQVQLVIAILVMRHYSTLFLQGWRRKCIHLLIFQ